MRSLGAIGVALTALRLNALRTVLAMLGIIIGIGSVIVMVSTGSGASARVDGQIAALGTNTLTINPASSNFGGIRGGNGTATPFNDQDVQAIAAQIDGVVAVSGMVPGNATLVNGAVNWMTQVNGVDASYLDIHDWPLADGRAFTDIEAGSAAKVAILGKTTADELFPGADSAVGRSFRINNIPFQVIGVLADRGDAAGSDQDDVALVPESTVRRRLYGAPRTVPNVVRTITLKVADLAEEPAIIADIDSLLRQLRHVPPGAGDNFRIQNPADEVRARAATQSTLSFLLGATALVSLLVGGIGIMNIMLVSVTARTREIGHD